MANNKEKIEDFGKKIGGAKKDKWRSRGLDLSDISDWNAAEIAKLVNKSNTWIKPDYIKMVESGVERELAWFIKKTIDSLPVSTYVPYNANDEQILVEAKKYISFVNLVKNKVNSYKSFEETKDFYNWVRETFLNDAGYAIKDEWSNISIGKLTSCAHDFYRYRANEIQQMNKRKFCYSENEKIDAAFNKRFSFYNKENCKLRENEGEFSIRAEDGSFFGASIFPINKDQAELFNNAKSLYFDNKEGICFSNDSLEDTKAKLRASFTLDKPEANRKKQFTYKPLDHIVRNGEEYRTKDASGDDFIKDMSFYGGEFGNWVSDKERQQNLNFAYDSFKDLGKALGFKDKDISLDKKLSIAFGARGAGKALAHYESLRQVINLTKLKGAGSLAHEYGHFLDHVINSYFHQNITTKFLSEDYSTEIDEKIPSKSDLLFAMKQKMATKNEQEEYRKKTLDNIKNKKFLRFIKNITIENCVIYKDIEMLFNNLEDGENIENVKKRFNNILKGYNNDLKNITDYKEKYIKDPKITYSQLHDIVRFCNKNRLYLDEQLNQYSKLLNEDLSKLVINTKFYDDAIKMDNTYSGGYWSSTKEMFARAFACYIKDKLSELGIENTYLTGHADSGIGFDDKLNEIYTFPVGDERNNINKAFDRFFEEVKVNVLGYEASKEFLESNKLSIKDLIEKSYDCIPKDTFKIYDLCKNVSFENFIEETKKYYSLLNNYDKETMYVKLNAIYNYVYQNNSTATLPFAFHDIINTFNESFKAEYKDTSWFDDEVDILMKDTFNYEKKEKNAKEFLDNLNDINNQKRFEKEVNDALSKEIIQGEANTIKICNTPQILINSGLKDLPIVYRKGHLRDALKEKNNKIHQHGLTLEQIYNIPKELNNPTIILKNKDADKSDSLIVVFDDIDTDKLPLFAAIKANTKQLYEYRFIDVNELKSIYGRRNFENYLDEVIVNNGLIYYDKEKVHDLDNRSGLQLSTKLSKYEPNEILQQFTENVNDNEQKRFKNEINIALSDDSINDIKICEMPLFLQNVGFENKPILYSKSHLRNAIAPFNREKHHHGISINDIYNLPNYIKEPAIILKNYKDNSKPILVFDAINSENAPLFAVLDINGKGYYEFKELDSNFMLSLYGKENFQNYLSLAAKNNEIVFYDKKRVQNIEALTALSLCDCISNFEPNKIIQKINENVNSEGEKTMSINENALFSFKPTNYHLLPIYHATREELKEAMNDLNWGNTPEDYFKIENGQYVFSNNYTIGAKEESIKKDLLSLQNKIIENSKAKSYIELLAPIVIGNGLFSNFDLKKSLNKEEITSQLLNYYKNDKDIFLAVVADLHNADNYKVNNNVQRGLLSKIQKAFNNLFGSGEENSLNNNIKENKKMEEKKYSSVEVVVPNRIGNNVVVGKVIETEVEREVKGEKKIFKEHFRNYYVPYGKDGDLMHFTLRSKPKDFVPVGDYSVLSIPNFDEKGQKVEIGKLNAETKKFDVSETKHLSQDELSNAIKGAFNKINSDELGYLCLPKACFYDKTKDGKEYVDKNGKSFKMLSLPDYLPEPYKKAVMPVYQTLSHTTNENLYVVKVEKDKPLNFKNGEENIEILGKDFLEVNKKAFLEHIKASKEISNNIADIAGKEPSGKLNSHENIAKQQQAPEITKDAKNNEKSHKNDGLDGKSGC